MYLRNNESVLLEERFPGYYRQQEGIMICDNQEELNAAKGIVMDLLKKAG
jgi:hypothetical protein